MAGHHLPLVRKERNAIIPACFFQYITVGLHVPQDNGTVFPAMSLFLTVCQDITAHGIGFPLSIIGTHHSQCIFRGVRFHRCSKKLCVQLLQYRGSSTDLSHGMHNRLWVPSHHISVGLPNSEIHRPLATMYLFLQGG